MSTVAIFAVKEATVVLVGGRCGEVVDAGNVPAEPHVPGVYTR